MMANRGRKSASAIDMPIGSIRFTQPKVDTKFQDGRLLKDTLQEILDNPEHMVRVEIPPIEVYWSSGGYHAAATGNRRLSLFKLLCEYGLIESVPVIVTPKKKSKPAHESQTIDCVQETILRKTIERHIGASAETPEKSDDNKAESPATPFPQDRKHRTPSQKSSRKPLGTLNRNATLESSELSKSVKKAERYNPRRKEDGKEKSTPSLKPSARKRKSEFSPPLAIQDQTDEKQSEGRPKTPVEMNATETFRCPNKSFEDEDKDDDSPKRLRLTPSPDPSLETELRSATTGYSQEIEDFNFD